MLDKIISTIKKFNMLEQGDIVVVGTSGGADSMSLLHILCTLREKLSLTLIAVHINHEIRGAEADRDQHLVEETCKELGVDCCVFKLDVKTYAKEHRITEEEAGRKLRYEKFEEVMQNRSGDKIAVAHNQNDTVETVLINLIRGSGLKGLTGIPAVNKNIIRPLIDCSRAEVEKYCEENKITYIIDSTNKENIYTRNKIRNQLIPYIKENINTNVEGNINRTASIISDEEDYLSECAKEQYEEAILKETDDFIKLNIYKLNHNKSVIAKRAIRIAIEKISNNKLKDITYEHINDILQLMKNQSGRRINLPNNIVVRKSFDVLEIYINDNDVGDYEYKIDELPAEVVLPDIKISICVVDKEETSADKYCKYFDYDRILLNSLCIRNRREGDYIYLERDSKRQKLKKLLSEKKMPIAERNQIPLLVQDDNVLCIIGYRDSPHFAVSESTSKILKVKIEPTKG